MAPPKKWDESSEEETSSDEDNVKAPQPILARKKFDDEEDSDDVADNWEEEEDSEVEREKAKQAAEAKAKADALAAQNRKSKSQRIEEHREANRRRMAQQDSDDSEEVDEAILREQAKAAEKNADLSHAQDLFGDVDLRNNKKAGNKATVVTDANNPGQAIDLATLPLFKPSTKNQFDQLSETLVPLLRASSTKPHFSLWMPNFAKGACQDMSSVDIKKVASALTALSNEKMKEEKSKDNKKTKAVKTKTTLAADRSMGRGAADTNAYDDDGLDDGDFM